MPLSRFSNEQMNHGRDILLVRHISFAVVTVSDVAPKVLKNDALFVTIKYLIILNIFYGIKQFFPCRYLITITFNYIDATLLTKLHLLYRIRKYRNYERDKIIIA